MSRPLRWFSLSFVAFVMTVMSGVDFFTALTLELFCREAFRYK